MQLTKYLFEAQLEDGTDIVIDFMQIESYSPANRAGLICVKMTGGPEYFIKADMTKMKLASGQVGVPIYPITTT